MADEDRNENIDSDQTDDADAGGGDESVDRRLWRTKEQYDESVNSKVEERLARERKKYEGYDEFRRKAEEYDKLEEQQKTELEKANDRAARLEQEASQARTELLETRTRSAIIAEAAKKNIDPDIAVAMVDQNRLEFDEAGEPKNAAEAVGELLKAKPWLGQQGGGRPGGADLGARGGAGGDQISREALKDMQPEEIRAALKDGKLKNVLSGG